MKNKIIKKTVSNKKLNLYSKVAALVEIARQNVVSTVNLTMVHTYFEIGRMIVEHEQQGNERAEYGKQVLQELSVKLTANFGKGFSEVNLRQMRNFYEVYSIQQTASAEFKIVSKNNKSTIQQMTPAEFNFKKKNKSSQSNLTYETFSHKFVLSWSHYLKLMRIENPDERSFYEIECAQNNWSLKELQRQFDSALFERLALSRDKKKVKLLAQKGHLVEQPADIIKDPYILEFIGLPEKYSYSETELETKLIDQLQHFLLELGKGFAFIGRQVRFTFDEKHFKIDLVFYNRLLRCFVLIDLKIGEVQHQDLGQIQMYVNYYDRFVKTNDENPSIGIILCKEKNETLIEITLPKNNRQIFASKYKTILPSKKQLRDLLSTA